MSMTVTRTNVVKHFLGAWTTTPVYTENVQANPDATTPHIRISIVPNDASQPCLGRDAGETWERDVGDIVLGIFVPTNDETDGLQLADDARRVISQQRFDETILDVGYIVPAGIDRDRRFYVWNVRIAYRTDNIRQEI